MLYKSPDDNRGIHQCRHTSRLVPYSRKAHSHPGHTPANGPWPQGTKDNDDSKGNEEKTKNHCHRNDETCSLSACVPVGIGHCSFRLEGAPIAIITVLKNKGVGSTQCSQEGNEIGFLFLCKIQRFHVPTQMRIRDSPFVVKVDHVHERPQAAIMHVWRGA